MADTEKNLEALEQEAVAETTEQVVEATAADAPKKNAVAAEPSKLSNEAEDLGAAVVKPTDSNPDATKKINQVSGDAQQKSAGAADPMPKLKEESEETVEEGKEVKAEEEESDEKKKEMKAGYMKASYKKEDIDVSEHVDALVNGETDLSEEFKNKASTIFEAAIKSKVAEITEAVEAEYNQKFESEIQKSKDELTEKVDSYLNYVVEEWMKENEIALERGIKGEIAEDFISGLKKLFSEHYIDVPDEQYDVLEDQASKIEDLEKKLNEQIEKNVELNKSNSDHVRQSVIAEASSDLADTAKEKFAKLTEEIEYSTEEDFRKKVATVKESYFGQKTETAENLDDVAAGDSSEQSEDLSNAMAAYTAAISKTKDIKLSVK